MVTLLLACAGSDPASADVDAVALLVRASLDLRGVRPSVAELDAVEDNPAALDPTIDAMIDDPRFRTRAADLFAEATLTRTEIWPYDLSTFGSQEPYASLVASIGDHPQQVFARVVADDLPITDLVLGADTVADAALASIWPLERAEGDGWTAATWTDGRPAAGLLTSTSLWWRYGSTDSNKNRKRANQVSRILLCHDYLTTPIEFDRNVDLLDQDALEEAVASDPDCTVCHATLDPIAAYMFGFTWYGQGAAEVAAYHPARERGWEDALGVAPAFYGQAGSDLSDLGRQIAADERFPSCMVERVFTGLLRRDVLPDDADALASLREVLIGNDARLRPVFRAVLDRPEYRATPGPDAGPRDVPLKLVTPQLLATSVEELTGYRLAYGDVDLLTSDVSGFLTLAGGADGLQVTSPIDSPNTTLLLVAERLAEAAAAHVVRTDADDPDHARLFAPGALDATPGSSAFRDQVAALHWRLFGRRVSSDGDEVVSAEELYDDVRPVVADGHEAWSFVLSSLLRDPDLLLY